MKAKTRNTIVVASAGLLVMMFLYAFTVKVRDFDKFFFDMNNQPFPNQFTELLVGAVLGVEIAIVLLLIFNRTRRWGFMLSAVTLAAFTIYILLVQLHAFSYVPCSCGGLIAEFTWWQHFFFNLFFLALSVAGSILLQPATSQTDEIDSYRMHNFKEAKAGEAENLSTE